MSLKVILILATAAALLSGIYLYSQSSIISEENATWKTASFTYYMSYAPCCPKNPNYDPKFPKTECEDYSACEYPGDFAAIGHKTIDWVKSHDIISFYDNIDPNGKSFNTKYGGKQIKLRKNGVEFTALIADTCGNQDCGNCCIKNSKPSGFLVDMEYYTVLKHFGKTSVVDGSIEFMLI